MCFMMLVLNDPQLQFTLLYNWTVYFCPKMFRVKIIIINSLSHVNPSLFDFVFYS